MTFGRLLHETKIKLHEAGYKQAALAARILLEWASNTTRKDSLVTPEKIINDDARQRLNLAIERCKRGESIHRIIGFREFYGLKFFLSPAVLEPRPDTEVLVDLLLPFLQKRAEECKKITLLDIGTGSGAIAISLLFKVGQLNAVGVDVSQEALDIAIKNAHFSGVGERFTALRSNLFENINEKYDVIVSNPPYICRQDIENLDKIVRDFDPILALDGGEDGLDFYRQLSKKGMFFLKKDGVFAVEIGKNQAAAVDVIFSQEGFELLEKKYDLGGIIRALLFKRAAVA